MSVPVIVVTGTVGVGKSTIAEAMHHILEKQRLPHGCVDIDWLRMSWPQHGLWNTDVSMANLASVWTNFAAAGAGRLIIVDVVEERSFLRLYEHAVPGADIKVCRLVAPESLRLARITSRDVGESRNWHLARTVELDAILDAAEVADFEVENGDRQVEAVALDVLVQAGWIDQDRP